MGLESIKSKVAQIRGKTGFDAVSRWLKANIERLYYPVMLFFLALVCVVVVFLVCVLDMQWDNAITITWRISLIIIGSIGLVLAFQRKHIDIGQSNTALRQVDTSIKTSLYQRYDIGVGMLWDTNKTGKDIAGCKVFKNLGLQDKSMGIHCIKNLVELINERRETYGSGPETHHRHHLVVAVSDVLSSFYKKWNEEQEYQQVLEELLEELKNLPPYFWQTWGKEIYFPGVSLRGANLNNAKLGNANLSEANLSEANLSKAVLSGADLSRANISEANLSKADFSGADLSGAILSGSQNLTSEQILSARWDRGRPPPTLPDYLEDSVDVDDMLKIVDET